MEPEERHKIGDIDRSERIRTGYTVRDGKLRQKNVHWDSPAWSKDGAGEHTVAAQLEFCRQHLEQGSRMFGAFDGELLVGVGLVHPEIGEGIAQLAYLHVSRTARRLGIGARIADALMLEARRSGAHSIYVSATPSGSAVAFYLKLGFQPTDKPIPELLELEPEDIHMVKPLSVGRS
jgi:ribosomal protein S18 acetylase RimI-like enzyme